MLTRESQQQSRAKLAQAFSWAAALSLCLPVLVLPAFWPGFSSVRQTVSALAAIGAPTRTAMTVCGSLTSVSLLLMAVLLSQAAPLGRLLLLGASVTAACVLLFPLPEPDSDTGPHTLVVTLLAFFLGFWPLASHARGRREWLVRFKTSAYATGALIAFGVTFWLHWLVNSPHTGLYERLFVFAEMASTVVFTRLGTQAPSEERVQAYASSRMNAVSAEK